MPTATESMNDHVERLGDGPPFVERVGVVPCPSEGCHRKGERWRILHTVVNVPCSRCQTDAERKRDEEDQRERIERLLSRAGAEPLFEGWSLDTFPDDKDRKAAKAAALTWIDAYVNKGENRNLLLVGPRGAGKTGLAWSIVRHLCERETVARFVNFPALLDQMRDAFQKKVPFDRHSDLGRVPVLVVDDVGAERPTEWTRGELFRLVDTRYLRMLPTIFTSNYETNALVGRLAHDDPVVGERIVSRMVAHGAMMQKMKAPDRRDTSAA